MSPSVKPGWVLVKESIPFVGKGIEDVVGAIRQVLTNYKFTQRFVFEIGKPITLEHMVHADEAPENKTIPVHEQIRNKPMREYPIEGTAVPGFCCLWNMVALINGEGLRFSRVLVGNKFVFQEWLKIQIPVTNMTFFGVPITQIPNIEDDVFILCGSDDEDEIQFSVKAGIP